MERFSINVQMVSAIFVFVSMIHLFVDPTTLCRKGFGWVVYSWYFLRFNEATSVFSEPYDTIPVYCENLSGGHRELYPERLGLRAFRRYKECCGVNDGKELKQDVRCSKRLKDLKVTKFDLAIRLLRFRIQAYPTVLASFLLRPLLCHYSHHHPRHYLLPL